MRKSLFGFARKVAAVFLLAAVALPLISNRAFADGEVASVGETLYATLQAAINAAGDGDTVTLLQSTSETPTIDGKNITLDLGGFTLTVDGYGLDVYGSTLTIENGTVAGDHAHCVYLNNNNTLTVAATATLSSPDGSGVLADLYPTSSTGVNTVNVYGTINAYTGVSATVATVVNVYDGATINSTDGAGILIDNDGGSNASTITVSGGTITGANTGISINGNIASNGPTITISGGSILTDGNETVALYLAGVGTTTVSGGTISGTASGIEIRAGDLSVTGGTISSTATGSTVVVTPNGNGSTTVGAGIAIAQHTTARPISVEISGGTISGISAVYESNPQNNASVADDVELSITGGTFNTTVENGTPVYSADLEDVMTGGTTNVAPAVDEIDDGYDAFLVDGDYVVLAAPTDAATALEVKIGETTNTTPFGGTAFDNITYAVDQGNIATYVAGQITGVDAGEAVATATLTGVKGTYTHTYNLTVSPVEYEIVEGDEQTYTLGSDEALTFRISGDLTKFMGVAIDDEATDVSNYELENGSTIISFNSAFANTLSAGAHTITATYTDGFATGSFTVAAKPVNPDTNDHNLNTALVFGAAAVVVLVSGAFVLRSSKE